MTWQDLSIYKGATFSHEFRVTGANGDYTSVSGYTGIGVIRENYGATGTLGSFSVTCSDSPTGTVQLSLSASGTAALLATQGRYDIELSLATGVLRALSGTVNIYPETNP